MLELAEKPVFQRERAHRLMPEIIPLLVAHKEEVAHYPDIPLAVDEWFYYDAEDGGMLRCYTARVARALVGYCVVFVKHNPHYKESLQAVQDVLFVLPMYRKTRIGAELVLFAERELQAEGCQVIYHHVKAANNVGRLMEYLGYELIDLVYGKRLDREEG